MSIIRLIASTICLIAFIIRQIVLTIRRISSPIRLIASTICLIVFIIHLIASTLRQILLPFCLIASTISLIGRAIRQRHEDGR